MQKHVNLVDLVKSFPTNIFLQNLASIQKRTSPIKFAHLAEKSENGSISNLSTKAKPWNGEPQYGAASIGAKVRVWWAGLGQFIDGYIMAYDAERRQSRPEVDADSS